MIPNIKTQDLSYNTSFCVDGWMYSGQSTDTNNGILAYLDGKYSSILSMSLY